MADLQEFASVLRATVTAPRLSGSKVQTLTSLALKLADQVPSQDTPLVTSFYKINASLPSASTSRISSLYVFDAIARGARTAATGAGGKEGKGKGKESAGALGLVTKLEGVVESWVTGMLDDGKGGLWAEGKEKVRKILEIWAKSQTFPQPTLDRLNAKLQARAAARPSAKTNGSSSDLLDSSYAVPDGPEQAQSSAPTSASQPPASMFSPTSAPKTSGTDSEQGQGLTSQLQSPSTSTPPATAPTAQPGLPPEILKLLGLSAQAALPTTSTSTPPPQSGSTPFGDPRLAKAAPPSYAAPSPLAAPAVPALPGLDLAAILASVKPVIATPPAAPPAHSPIPPFAPGPSATDPRLAARPPPQQQQAAPAPGQAYPLPFPPHQQLPSQPPFAPGQHGVRPPAPPQTHVQGQPANMGQNLKPDQLRLLASFAQPPPPPSGGGGPAPFSPPPQQAAGGHARRDSRDFDPVQRGGRPRSRSPGPRRFDGPPPPAQRGWNAGPPYGGDEQQPRRESWQDGDGAQRGRGGQRGGRGGYAGDRGDWRGNGGPGPEAGGPGGGRAPLPDRPPQQQQQQQLGRAPLSAAPPGKDEFGRDLPVSASDGKPAGDADGEEDMALDDSDDDGKGPGRNGPMSARPPQQTQQYAQHQVQQHQPQQLYQRQQGQFPPPPPPNHNNTNRFGGPGLGASAGPTLQTFDLSTFNPMSAEAWAALGQAWKNSTGREANQMDLMAFLASGGNNIPPA